MKTAHRQASHAKRRWQADPMSIFKTFSKIQPFTPDEQAILAVPPRLAFEKLKNGHGTQEDFDTLAIAVNVTMVLSEKIGIFAEQSAIAASNAMIRALERHKRLGRWGFDAVALQDIAIALDVHDQLLALLTPLQITEAAKEVDRRKEDGEFIEI
jgi:hypothetical protein